MQKNLINKYNKLDVIKDCANFLKLIKDKKLYIIKFEQDEIIKPKIYPNNCVVKVLN